MLASLKDTFALDDQSGQLFYVVIWSIKGVDVSIVCPCILGSFSQFLKKFRGNIEEFPITVARGNLVKKPRH